MHFGMPTLIELDTLEENVQLCKALALDFVEINMNFPEYQLDNLKCEELLRLQSTYDVFFTFHLAEDIDFGHLNSTIRQAYVKEFTDTLKLMNQIGSKKLNLHMAKGIFVTLPNQKINIYEQYEKRYLDNIKEVRQLTSDFLRDSEIEVLIENTGILDRPYIQEAVSLLLEDRRFKLTWDIGHDHSSDFKDKDYLQKHLESIKHYHIHDAVDTRNHLTLYNGDIDIDHYLSLAKSTASTVVIETKTIEALKTSVKRLKEKSEDQS